jgi:phosphoribosylformylglycinamidine cyclo-ligase
LKAPGFVPEQDSFPQSPPAQPPPSTYAEAGVDVSAGARAVELIKAAAHATRRPGVLGDIGSFGGLFALDATRYRSPVLVASTDGVGTKAQVARATGRLSTVGIDLVAMCVDDVVCQGAEPLFFLDYVAVGKLDPEQVAKVVEGVAAGCCLAGCALIGGEMAEHPGTMEAGDFDLAGFAVGVVERDRLIDGSTVEPGDVLIGLHSPGLRSNGYSLARAIFERSGRHLDEPAWSGAARTLADELLEPSVIYAPAVLSLLRSVDVRALAHITGGGIAANLTRVLPGDCAAVLSRRTWATPRIFDELQQLGGIADEEMAGVFNLGLGMIAVVAPADAGRTIELLTAAGVMATAVGGVVVGAGGVRLTA